MFSKIVTVSRIALGLLFAVNGLNGFLGLIPQPSVPEPASAFLGALAATGYMLPLLKGTELLTGLLLLANRFVPLALVLLAPVVVNIVAFHLFLAPPNPIVAGLLTLELFLAWAYRDHFRGALASRSQPTASVPTSILGTAHS